MRKLLSVLSSTLQGGVRGGLLFFALLATTNLWAYDFEVDGVFYNILNENNVEVTYKGSYSDSYEEYSGEVTIPEIVTYNGTTYSITSIGLSAFAYCSALTSVTIPNSVTSIRDHAFFCCSSLTSVTIGNSVTSIGYEVFYYCKSLTSVTIPNSVTSIGSQAFYYCESLTSITIPNSVTSMGYGAFNGCSSLTSIVVESGNSTYDSRENCNAIIETATNTLIAGCQNTIIPNSVTSIGERAFFQCRSLTSITIPNSVTSIGEMAFCNCIALTSITIPNSVTSIGDDAFSGCISLTSVTIPNSVTSIGERAFRGCYALTSVTIGNSVTSIGDYAFSDCFFLTSVTIPNSVTSIGDYAFHYCSALTSMVVESGNSTYDSRENCNAIIETATNTLIAGCQNTIIPNSVTSIGDGAFAGCEALTSVTIPNSVTSIGDYAFDRCFSLETVICEAIEVPELGDDVFYDMPLSEATLYVPAQSLDDYKIADQWKDFGTILPIEESEEEIELQDTEMTVVFTNSEDNDSEIYSQSLTVKVPAAPEIEGFTFLGWQPVATLITDTITIQAIYEAHTPSATEEVYTNPANPAQKLLRNGQVYILQDGKTYTITGQRF